MDLRQAQQQLAAALDPLYGSREAASIADWVMEHLTGLGKVDRLMKSRIPLSDKDLMKYYIYRTELLANRPVQYVLHESWFAKLKFYVDENVLIPRPETEELIDWAVGTIVAAGATTAVAGATIAAALPDAHCAPAVFLDVGTGSGCIPVTVALRLPHLAVHACDISKGALEVARRNAANLHAAVGFHHLDFLDPDTWRTLPQVQWLISNPPYIPESQRPEMSRHVTEAEPALALFVPDEDPLVFYRALGEFAVQHLLPGGALFAEIHETMAESVTRLLQSAAARVEVRKDMMGKDRMIKATW